MEIIKIIGVGLLTLIISILLKDVKKEFSIYAVIIGTSIILFLSMDILKEIINLTLIAIGLENRLWNGCH